MKFLFYLSLVAFIAYEFLNNYFVMSYPGSQELDSLVISHTLNYYKVYFEIAILFIITYSGIQLFKKGNRFAPSIMIILSILFYIVFNFIFTAENRFRHPQHLVFELAGKNNIENNLPVVGVELNGESKAYPVDYIRYHHRVIDSIGGKIILVTYCGLCKTGRVYEPFVNGKYTKFRLVGINHYNAMFEDANTKSWWSQETGICIAGKLKGARLNEVNCDNMTLKKWVELHPTTKRMLPDPQYKKKYRTVNDYLENAENPVQLEKDGTWSDHTFVVGISNGLDAKAYEWNYLIKNRIVNDKIGNTYFFLAVSNDNISFTAFENPYGNPCSIRNDTLFIQNIPYNFAGVNLVTSKTELIKINAYREFWFSWLFAHPNTVKYYPQLPG